MRDGEMKDGEMKDGEMKDGEMSYELDWFDDIFVHY